MSAGLLVGIAGLAMIDSLNPATIVGVALILLLPSDRVVGIAIAFVCGAYGTVLVVGMTVYFAAEAAAGAVPGGLAWVRRIAFGVVSVILLVSAVRRLRHRERRPIAVPSWLTLRTAAPLGLLATGADLPNAFPYFIAIERLVSAAVPTDTGILVLSGYSLIYCLPCMLLLAAAAAWGDRVRRRLHTIYERFGKQQTVGRSVPAAMGLAALGIAAAGLALTS